MTERTYRDRMRAAIAHADSAWGEETGDGDAIPAYIDTLTESALAARDEQLAITEQARTQAWRQLQQIADLFHVRADEYDVTRVDKLVQQRLTDAIPHAAAALAEPLTMLGVDPHEIPAESSSATTAEIIARIVLTSGAHARPS